jgi:hypothetical protein
LTKERANQSEANLVNERAKLGDGVLPVADNLEGGLLLPGKLAHARLLQLQLLAQLQLNLPLKRRKREIFKPKTYGSFCLHFFSVSDPDPHGNWKRIDFGRQDPHSQCGS